MPHDKNKYYFNRTVAHIHRVQNNMLFLVTECDHFSFRAHGLLLTLAEPETKRLLMHNVMMHDRSKFDVIQFAPYIELTEYYRQKRLGNKEYQYPSIKIKDSVSDAILNHYDVENHHPEGIRNVFKINLDELIEIVCDLEAMAQEYGEVSCREYFENVWLKKHCHSKSFAMQFKTVKYFMNRIIRLFEERVVI